MADPDFTEGDLVRERNALRDQLNAFATRAASLGYATSVSEMAVTQIGPVARLNRFTIQLAKFI